jgi:hypothetical protein
MAKVSIISDGQHFSHSEGHSINREPPGEKRLWKNSVFDRRATDVNDDFAPSQEIENFRSTH